MRKVVGEMGDRGNIVVVNGFDPDSKVYLYTHWSGSQLPQIVWNAMRTRAARNRWNDESYLTRIVFNHLQGDDRGELGFGIAARIGDGTDQIVEINCHTQRVTIEGQSWSFQEFVDLPAAPSFVEVDYWDE